MQPQGLRLSTPESEKSEEKSEVRPPEAGPISLRVRMFYRKPRASLKRCCMRRPGNPHECNDPGLFLVTPPHPPKIGPKAPLNSPTALQTVISRWGGMPSQCVESASLSGASPSRFDARGAGGARRLAAKARASAAVRSADQCPTHAEAARRRGGLERALAGASSRTKPLVSVIYLFFVGVPAPPQPSCAAQNAHEYRRREGLLETPTATFSGIKLCWASTPLCD